MPKDEYMQVYGKSREVMVEETRSDLRDALKKKDKILARKMYEKLKKAYIGDDIFWANEVGTNIFLIVVMAIMTLILLFTIAMSEIGVYSFNNDSLVTILMVLIVAMLAGMAICIYYRGEKHWIKYVLMLAICITIADLSAYLTYRVTIALTIPVILSTKYLSHKFTRFIAIVSGFCMIVATFLSIFVAVSVDLNFAMLKYDVSILYDNSIKYILDDTMIADSDYRRVLVVNSLLPNLLQFGLISYICCAIAKWGHNAVVDQADISQTFAKVDAELKLAGDIQNQILPNVFPPFPDRKEIDLYASMKAAKMVGGDFYDFFLIDESHLALVIADVSDKGVPAALFMMTGKAFIKNQVMLGKSPAEVLEIVNNQLCENNEAGLFISAWLGIVDLKTGEVVAANAGHEFPAVKSGGEYKLVSNKNNIVLAAIEDAKYANYTINLSAGDSIYLYTDGVTEAANSEEARFGKERMLESLNNSKAETQEALLNNIQKDLASFVGDAHQHDDITMVGFKYLG